MELFPSTCAFLARVFAYRQPLPELEADIRGFSESTSIPVNPRTNRPVGYAFVDLTTAPEADHAISELSGKEILDRKVSVQLARNPAEKNEASGGEGSGGEGRKRGSGRGRGRGRGRGGRFGRGGRTVSSLGSPGAYPFMTNCCFKEHNGEATETAPAAATEAEPLADVTNQAPAAESAEGKKEFKPRTPRPHKQRGPPEDGVPSKTKVMVANLPYDLSEEKVGDDCGPLICILLILAAAQGTLRHLRAHLCQDCPPPHPSLHGQEASSSQRASQGTWVRLCHTRVRGDAGEGRQRDERKGD